MKIIALVFLAFISFAFAQVGAPVVTATTLSSSKTDVKSVTSGGVNQSQTVRGIGVAVDWRFFGRPEEPYEVQCFFVAKHEGTKSRYVFDAVKAVSKEPAGKTEFRAQPLIGSGRQWMNIPFTATVNVRTTTDTVDSQGRTIGTSSTTTTDPAKGVLTLSNEIIGSKIEGWIVRIVSGGRVTRITSNQNHLEALAHGISNTLDAIAEGSRKQ